MIHGLFCDLCFSTSPSKKSLMTSSLGRDMLHRATTIRVRSDQLRRGCIAQRTLERVAACGMQHDYVMMRCSTRLARSPLQVWKSASSRLGWIVPRQTDGLGMEVGGRPGSLCVPNHHNMSNNANVQQAKADGHAAVNKAAHKSEQVAKYVERITYGC